MSCGEYKAELIEAARGASIPSHVEECAQCALFLEQQTTLTEIERSIADVAAPAHLEALLINRFVVARRRSGNSRWLWAAGAVAASLALVWWLRPAPRESPFLVIPYTQPIGPDERAEVVRMEMPVAALIAAGFPVETSDAGADAIADVVVGEDGRARAVRIISISEGSINR